MLFKLISAISLTCTGYMYMYFSKKLVHGCKITGVTRIWRHKLNHGYGKIYLLFMAIFTQSYTYEGQFGYVSEAL